MSPRTLLSLPIAVTAVAVCAALADQAREPSGSPRPASAADASASQQSRFRLVVASFQEQGVPPGMGDVVADMIIRTIDSPHVDLLERRQVKRVLDEQSFATSDLTEPGEAMRYGQLVDSRYVLVGSVYRLDGNYIVSARMVDAASGVIPHRGRAVHQFRTVDEMASSIRALVHVLGLCEECAVPTTAEAGHHGGPPGAASLPAFAVDGPTDPARQASSPTTVRDALERIGGQRNARVAISLPTPRRTLATGEQLSLQVLSEQDGYLSLFVVDADGAVSMLLPNKVATEFRVRAGVPAEVPTDAGFRLRIQPPLGATRVKALVTERPLPLAGDSSAGGLLRSVNLSDVLVGSRADGTTDDVGQWASSEIEFLVVQGDSTGAFAPAKLPPADPDVERDAQSRAAGTAADAVIAALDSIRNGAPDDGSRASEVLRWPLRSPFTPRVDIGAVPVSPALAASAPLIAVIDADFDADDPLLADAFGHLDDRRRKELREEVRRNGDAPYRHGNRVASIISGSAPWLPSVIPGARILPLRVTSQVDGPDYRVHRGDADQTLKALRAAMDAGCRIINLSLSIHGDEGALAAFLGDPVWDELQRRDVLLVCAAGNSGKDLDANPSYPACIDRPNILCVGAIDPAGNVARWEGARSCTGKRTVDVMAPGTLIAVSDGGGSVALANGTSYACAFATGVAALFMAANQGASAAATAEAIRAAARQRPELAPYCQTGLLTVPVADRR